MLKNHREHIMNTIFWRLRIENHVLAETLKLERSNFEKNIRWYSENVCLWRLSLVWVEIRKKGWRKTLCSEAWKSEDLGWKFCRKILSELRLSNFFVLKIIEIPVLGQTEISRECLERENPIHPKRKSCQNIELFSRYRSFAVEVLKIIEIPIVGENRKFKRRTCSIKSIQIENLAWILNFFKI